LIPESAGARRDLPAGFRWSQRAGWRIAVREDVADVLAGAVLEEPDSLAARARRRFRGRGRPALVDLADGSSAVLRRYLHGGFLRHLTRGLFLGAPRPVRELVATEHARAAGVRVPEVLAAFFRRRALLFHEGWILTREVRGARDLTDCLRAGEAAGVLLRRVGREVRRMHDAGVLHADLHVKNVLVVEDGVVLIDFDRATVRDAVPEPDRVANLLRFDRSVEKLGRSGVRVPGRARLRVFRGHRGARHTREQRAELLRRCRRGRSWHRFWWALTGAGKGGG